MTNTTNKSKEQATKSNNRLESTNLDLYKTYIDLYKHHFDLFVKGIVVYLAAMGVSSGYAFKKETEVDIQIGLLALISLISFIVGSGCVALVYWLKKLKILVDNIEQGLQIQQFPFQGGRAVGIVVASSVFTISIAAAVVLIFKIGQAQGLK